MLDKTVTRCLTAAAMAAVMASMAGGAHAQFTTSDFTPYSPSAASSVVPGLTALYSVQIQSLVPTQINVGNAEVNAKAAAFDLIPTQASLTSDLLGTVEPVVIGPNGLLYQTDGHHSFVALEDSIWGLSNPTNPNPTVYVQVIANYSNLTPTQFINAMAQATQLYPFNNGVQQTVTPSGPNLLSPLPTSLAGLTNDPYRGLEYSVLKNNGPAGVGHDKTAGYSDFMWADVFRTAPGVGSGSGLPTLTPADANNAAGFVDNGNNTGTLPGLGTVKVNQMPGYILPGSINVTGQITNANLGTGAIDGSNSGNVATPSMTGINGYTTNGIVVVPQVSGLLMQLGNDSGGTVTLSNMTNSYTGGTTITAGTLITAIGPAADALGAASTGAANVSGCAGANNYSSCIDNAVRATNGIVFESLSEGNGTLQFGTNTSGGRAMTENRNISIGQEIANFNMNGNTVTLTGNLFTPNINTSGAAPLVVDGKGTLILAPASGSNPLFYGNIEISKGTLQVASDAAMGATTGPMIGQVEMDNGTFQAGASFASARSMFMHGSVSTYDTNGFNTSWAGGLTDVQRTLQVTNSSTTTAGKVTFNSLAIGATASLEPTAGTSPGVSVVLTNGVTREANATLMLRPGTGTLGTTEQVFDNSSGPGASSTVKSGMVAPWIIEDTGGGASSSPYKFLTYNGTKGYIAATAGATTLSPTTGSDLVVQSGSVALNSGGSAYALQLQASGAVTVGSNQTLTIDDGTDPAGLILNSKASISGGTLAFGGSEAVMYAKGSTTNANTITSAITGTGGITLSGSGQLNLNTASTETGAVVIDSGQLVLNAANALSASSGVMLQNTNSKAEPGNAILSLGASNTIAAINDNGTNSQIFLGGAGAAGTTQTGAGIVLTIGEATGPNANQSSSISSIVTDSGATTGTAGAITKNGSGLLDFSGGGTGSVTLNGSSSIVVNGGQLLLATDTLTNANTISTAGGTQVQFVKGGSNAFASNITGGGMVHVEEGALQLTGTGNTYSGGTTLEIGTALVGTTSTLSSTNQNITNAGGTLVLDQTTSGNFTGVMSDGAPQGQGPTISGSFVKADSTGSNSGNVTITNAQLYTGATTIEAGTLTLGATNAVATSGGVTLGAVGGGATATLALGANNTVQGLNSVAGNTTGVQLNGNALTVHQSAGATSSFGGSISDSGTGSLNTSGGGTLALSGANSIGGTMSVGSGTTLSQTGGSLAVGGSVTNNGTFVVNSTTATFGGTFTNNGLYTSDPSTQTFNNLAVGENGAIQASLGDLYRVGGNFSNASTQSGTWNTIGAGLEFITGSVTNHILGLVGSDLGAIEGGYVGNFAWGTLTIDAGNSLTLQDGLSGNNKVAFYVEGLVGADVSGDDITNITGDGFNIYYNSLDTANAYLDGLTYALADGGELIADPVPEPASLALLLTGLAGVVVARRRKRA